AYPRQRLEPVVLSARGDDCPIKLRGGIDIVVVIVKAGRLELLGLPFLEQPQGRASLEPERPHCPHHLDYALEIALLRTAPRRPHAEAGGPIRFGQARGGHNLPDRQQFLVLDARLITSGLGAIGAILRTTAGLDRDERGELYVVR